MDAVLIQQVRSFNRIVTQTIGALHDHYLGRERPLGESRLLFEIGEQGAAVSALRDRLDLDSGYVSRLLRSLERQNLVATAPDTADKRVRRARLTRAGRAELRQLNRKSDQLAGSILEHLNDRQRARLTGAMADVERLLSASAVRINEEAPTSSDAQYCLGRYFAELAQRFDTGFDPAKSLTPSLDSFAPPRGVFLVARLHARRLAAAGSGRSRIMPTSSGCGSRRTRAASASAGGCCRRWKRKRGRSVTGRSSSKPGTR